MPFFTNDGRSQPRRAGKHLMGVITGGATGRTFPWGSGSLYLSEGFDVGGRTFPWGPGIPYLYEGFDHCEPPFMSAQIIEGFDS